MSKPEIKWRSVPVWQCVGCGFLHDQDCWSSAPNPFNPDGAPITGCVECYEVNSFVRLCASEGCLRITNCGGPHPDGVYRMTCRQHNGAAPK